MQQKFNIPLFKVTMDNNVPNELQKVILSGKISQYDKVDKFEKLLRNYIGNNKVNFWQIFIRW